MALKLPDLLRKGLNKLPGVSIDAQLVSDLGNPAAWLQDFFGGTPVLSGENVNGNSSMELTAFYAALRNISEDIAKLPVNIFEVVPGGKKQDNTQPLFGLLNIQVNPYVSAMSFYQTLTHWALNYGNGYAEIVRDSLGRPVEMWPIHPTRVEPFFRNDILFYRVSSNNTIEGQRFDSVILPAEDVYNLVGLGPDGIVGYSVFTILAQSIGVGLATQNCAASYYGNGTNLSGVLESPEKLSKDQYKRMRISWNRIHTGSAANKNKVAILENGTTFKATQSTASDAQLIEARKFTVIEVARILRIPPHKLQSTDKMTLNNLESQSIEYVSDTLTPWIKRIRLETSRKLIKNPRFFAVHEVRLLTLGDSKTRAGVFKTHRNMGTMSINEVRDFEELNALPEDWANEYHMQMNITTVEAISEKANLRDTGQNGSTTMESGEKDPEGRDPEASTSILDAFEEAKAAHMPNFIYAARRIVNKESKSIDIHLKKSRQDLKGFTKWAEHFFDKQKADIVDVFTPCCEVFMNTIEVVDFVSNWGFLEEFAENYAFDGIKEATYMWQCQADEHSYDVDLEKQEQKLANVVINLIGSKAKETEK